MSRRLALLVSGALAAIFAGALGAALLSTRRIEGAIPGSGAVLSLAASGGWFAVGTTKGVGTSPDGITWAVAQLPKGRSLVAGSGGATFALAGGKLFKAGMPGAFALVSPGPIDGSAMAPGPGGGVFVAGRSRIVDLSGAGPVDVPAPGGGPASVDALGVSFAQPGVIYEGSASSGLWSLTGGRWRRLLGTPVVALLVDPARPERILAGTPGSLLVSENAGLTWRFTELRTSVSALAYDGGRFYAAGGDRLIMVSADGDTRWRALAEH